MKEPPMSCPYLDSAIDEIESARKIHSNLRDYANHWKEEYYELEKVSSTLIDDLRSQIKQLEDEICELKAESAHL